jgi:hypothetical protein
MNRPLAAAGVRDAGAVHEARGCRSARRRVSKVRTSRRREVSKLSTAASAACWNLARAVFVRDFDDGRIEFFAPGVLALAAFRIELWFARETDPAPAILFMEAALAQDQTRRRQRQVSEAL